MNILIVIIKLILNVFIFLIFLIKINHFITYKLIHTEYIIKHRQVRFYTLRRMALAFALIKQMLKLENRLKEACDFGRDLWIASRAATCAKKQ